MTTNYTASERTNKFVVALKMMEEAESAVLDAMSETYGETQGDQMTHELPFGAINDEILRCMRCVILEDLYQAPQEAM